MPRISVGLTSVYRLFSQPLTKVKIHAFFMSEGLLSAKQEKQGSRKLHKRVGELI